MLCLLLFSQPTQSDKAPCLGKELSTECQLPLSFPPLSLSAPPPLLFCLGKVAPSLPALVFSVVLLITVPPAHLNAGCELPVA